MKFKVEQVAEETEESVSVYCHDPREDWVNKVQEAALGQVVDFGFSVKTVADINKFIRNRKKAKPRI